jgi:RNA-directed DNA polymerase
MIPKGSTGKFRKLGIPTITDRVVQASLKLVLEPIFDADFKPCSYGFRPNRRAQDAVAEIHYYACKPRNYHWVLEADIEACFDEISHRTLMDRLRARITDKRICALVKAFLKAGVLTEIGKKEETLTGTPQGGILSPLLANITLSALDDHFDRQWLAMGSRYQRAKRKAAGHGVCRLIRYADDHAWGRLMRWVRAKYGGQRRMGMVKLRRRFCDKGWRFAYNGVMFTGASSVAVTRYRYRGSTIPTPWTPRPGAAISG